MKTSIKHQNTIKQILTVKLEGESNEIAVFVNGSRLPVRDSNDAVKTANFLGKITGIVPSVISHKVGHGWSWKQISSQLIVSGKLKKFRYGGFFPV